MTVSQSDSYNHRIVQPNYTQIPNIIFDHWMNHLDSSTFKLLLFICRKTLGWHKNKDCLSLKKLEEGTHLSKTTITRCIRELESFGLIKKELHKNKYGDQDPNTYELIINEEVVQNLDNPVQNLDNGGSPEFRQGVVQNLDTQKKDIQKKDKSNDLSIAHGTYVKFTEEQYASLCNTNGKEKTDEIIQSINDHCVNNRPNGYKDYVAAFRTFLKNYKAGGKVSTRTEGIDLNITLAKLYEKNLVSSTHTINVCPNYVEILPKGPTQPIIINYSELGFKEQFENALRKCGFKNKMNEKNKE
jgi:replication protein O